MRVFVCMQAPLQAGRMPAHDTPTPEQNVQLDLLICIAGFVGALTGTSRIFLGVTHINRCASCH